MSGSISQSEFDTLVREHWEWNRIGRDHGRQLDLTRRSLHGLDLRGVALDGTVLIEADLAGCDLTGADFTHALMMGANLQGARLVNADLYKANLTEADLSGADLSAARLLRTDCPRAVMVEATLDGCEVTKTFFLHTDLRRAQVRGASFSRTGFSEDRINGADFTGSTGYILEGSTVIVEDDGSPVDAVAALNAAGAQVSEFRPDQQAESGE